MFSAMSNIDSTPGSRSSKRRTQKPARKSRKGSPGDWRNEEFAKRQLATIRVTLEDYPAQIRTAENLLRSEGIRTGGEVEELTRLLTFDATDNSNGAAL
jgi:hypothetical protein